MMVSRATNPSLAFSPNRRSVMSWISARVFPCSLFFLFPVQLNFSLGNIVDGDELVDPTWGHGDCVFSGVGWRARGRVPPRSCYWSAASDVRSAFLRYMERDGVLGRGKENNKARPSTALQSR